MIKHRLIAAGIAVLVALAAGWYIQSLISRNASQAVKIDNLEASVSALTEAAKQKGKNDAKYKTMPVTDLDRLGSDRGWLRPVESR